MMLVLLFRRTKSQIESERRDVQVMTKNI